MMYAPFAARDRALVGLDRRRVWKTVASIRNWHTTGRGRMPHAVRKAEACPPAPDPASQVAADLEARIRAISRA